MKTIIVEIPDDYTPEDSDILDAVTDALSAAFIPAYCYQLDEVQS